MIQSTSDDATTQALLSMLRENLQQQKTQIDFLDQQIIDMKIQAAHQEDDRYPTRRSDTPKRKVSLSRRRNSPPPSRGSTPGGAEPSGHGGNGGYEENSGGPGYPGGGGDGEPYGPMPQRLPQGPIPIKVKVSGPLYPVLST